MTNSGTSSTANLSLRPALRFISSGDSWGNMSSFSFKSKGGGDSDRGRSELRGGKGEGGGVNMIDLLKDHRKERVAKRGSGVDGGGGGGQRADDHGRETGVNNMMMGPDRRPGSGGPRGHRSRQCQCPRQDTALNSEQPWTIYATVSALSVLTACPSISISTLIDNSTKSHLDGVSSPINILVGGTLIAYSWSYRTLQMHPLACVAFIRKQSWTLEK
ncbi:hypothetical protein CPC08DRAFT_724983 [Agrocybe pediades]|nr:hypothetical protein CPC08DRAFT_724983 [Agrocybe pediades]